MLEVVYTTLLIAVLVVLSGLGCFAVYRLFRASAPTDRADRTHPG